MKSSFPAGQKKKKKKKEQQQQQKKKTQQQQKTHVHKQNNRKLHRGLWDSVFCATLSFHTLKYILAHLSLQAHWWAYRIGRPPSSVRRPHSLNISSEITVPISQISYGASYKRLMILKIGMQHRVLKYYQVYSNLDNVVVVWRLHYITTLKQELSGTKAYKETSEEEKSVVNGHCNHLALKFSVCVKERQDRLPTMYWLPKLHKRPIYCKFKFLYYNWTF